MDACARSRRANRCPDFAVTPGSSSGFQDWLDVLSSGAQATPVRSPCDALSAATALEYGLVAEVVPGEKLMGRALELAGKIAANPGHATRMAKRLMREGAHMKLHSLLELAASYQAIAHYTQDHHEAIAAFLGKRAPEFKDK